MAQHDIHERARGRWRSLLPALGVSEQVLTGNHTACPMCGGKDRFRWDNRDGTGSYICNQCKAGSGVDLVMRVNGLQFMEAVKLIEEHLGDAKLEMPKAQRQDNGYSDDLWRRSVPLSGVCPASKYLAGRGILMRQYPAMLRYSGNVAYTYDDKSKPKTHHPALLAKFVSEDAKKSIVQVTYLDSEGRKADVPKVRKLAPGVVPKGGAVRLSNSAETMGVAEGVETSMSAAMLFEVPVWATLTSGLLTHWSPPATAKNIMIFMDVDASLTGQEAAYTLARRLKRENYAVDLYIPPDMEPVPIVEMDWNDVLKEQATKGVSR